MKRSFKSVVLALAFASACCLGTSCKKSDDTKKVKESSEETPVSATHSSADSDVGESDKKIPENTTADLHLTDYQIEIAKPPVSTKSDGTSIYETKEGELGYGNSCNAAIATGNKDYQFYVVHPEVHIIAIEMEKLSTGESYIIYSPRPVQGIEQNLDMLTLYDQYLYFRENETEIKRIDLTDFSVKEIAEGKIDRMIIYEDSIFFGQDSSIVRCDLDGSNRTDVYTSQFKDQTVDIAFCINDGKILFSDPKEEREDGLAYGKIYAMDLDGQNQTEILPDVIAANDNVFFSDGESLYFYGEMPNDPAMKMLTDPDMQVIDNNFVTMYSPEDEDDTDSMITGFFCVKLDGSETTFIQSYPAGSVNVSDGMIFWSAGNCIFVAGEGGVFFDRIDNAQIFEADTFSDLQFVIVGDWVYYSYIDPEGSGDERTRRSYLGGGYIVCVDWPAYPYK